MTRFHFRLCAATLALLIGLAAPARAEPVTLLLDWFLNPDHGPLVVAQEKGFFAAEGLEVEMIEPADPNDPPKLVAAGKADLAVSYQPQLHIQAARGLPLARVGTLIATPLNTLLVLDTMAMTTTMMMVQMRMIMVVRMTMMIMIMVMMIIFSFL